MARRRLWSVSRQHRMTLVGRLLLQQRGAGDVRETADCRFETLGEQVSTRQETAAWNVRAVGHHRVETAVPCVPATSPRRAAALLSLATASRDFMRESML